MRTGIFLRVCSSERLRLERVVGKRTLKRGGFHALVDLQAAINRFVAETTENPKPFCWTADPDTIIAAVKRGYQALDSIH